MIRKGRNREDRGLLTSFYELPVDKQNIFLTIKKVINENSETEKVVYIFGSYYWGFWDSMSDFDVRLDINGVNKTEIIRKLKEEYNIMVDVIHFKTEKGVLIP